MEGELIYLMWRDRERERQGEREVDCRHSARQRSLPGWRERERETEAREIVCERERVSVRENER